MHHPAAEAQSRERGRRLSAADDHDAAMARDLGEARLERRVQWAVGGYFVQVVEHQHGGRLGAHEQLPEVAARKARDVFGVLGRERGQTRARGRRRACARHGPGSERTWRRRRRRDRAGTRCTRSYAPRRSSRPACSCRRREDPRSRSTVRPGVPSSRANSASRRTALPMTGRVVFANATPCCLHLGHFFSLSPV